jgi:hypothetical protein
MTIVREIGSDAELKQLLAAPVLAELVGLCGARINDGRPPGTLAPKPSLVVANAVAWS